MSEEEAKMLACKHIASSSIGTCTFDSIRFFTKSDTCEQDEWAAVFTREPSTEYIDCPDFAIVIIDDATGKTEFFDVM